MIIKFIRFNFLISFFLLITSCSYFAEKISTINDSKNIDLSQIRSIKKSTFQCLPEEKTAVTLEDENVAKFFKNDLRNIFLNPQYSFVQKAVFLTLIEIARRPDTAGLNSRFQAAIKFNNKFYYFDNENIQVENIQSNEILNTSLYYGLNEILKIQHRDESLQRLAKVLDHSLNLFMPVSGDFEVFLNTHKKTIAKNTSLAEIFLKGEETVTKFESFPRNNFSQLLQYYESQSKKSTIKMNTYRELTYQIDSNKSSTIFCNKKLDDATNEKNDYDKIMSHHFSFKDGDNFFIGITSSIFSDEIKPISDNFYQLNNKPNPIALPICLIKNKNKEILVASIEGRNPHQHLKHLINYELDKVDSVLELNDVLNFSRHLFLSNPDRILYESKKGRKAQLDFFLSKKFPIYHVENLGQIVGFSLFEKKSHLILDSRKATVLWCHK